MQAKRRWVPIVALVPVGFATLLFFALGLHLEPRYIRNFEEEEFGQGRAFMRPLSVEDGLAVYNAGGGEPVLLLPYPHGHTIEPMAEGPIAEILVESGRTVVTFDPPGAFRSTREPVGDMDEMLRAADETLDRLEIETPVDVVGHSMGGLVALAFAIERPERVRRLVLANSVSGFPAAVSCGYPGSAFGPLEADYWRVIIWGMRINGGRADLALHKKLYNLMGSSSGNDNTLFTPLEIDADDYEKGVPIRMIWSRNMYRRLSYADRLQDVEAPTLILAGRHDPEASLTCSEELVRGIPNATLMIFEHSGHAPFIEEAELFKDALEVFLGGGGESD